MSHRSSFIIFVSLFLALCLCSSSSPPHSPLIISVTQQHVVSLYLTPLLNIITAPPLLLRAMAHASPHCLLCGSCNLKPGLAWTDNTHGMGSISSHVCAALRFSFSLENKMGSFSALYSVFLSFSFITCLALFLRHSMIFLLFYVCLHHMSALLPAHSSFSSAFTCLTTPFIKALSTRPPPTFLVAWRKQYVFFINIYSLV